MVLIRRATASDVPVCANLMLEHPVWQSYGYAFDDQCERLNRLFSDRQVLIADNDGAIRGFIVFDTRTLGDNGYVQLVAVDSRFTGNGIGERLMKAAHAAMAPLQRCFLLCTSTNVQAQRFYRRRGYVKVGELPDWLQVGTTEYVFCHYHIQSSD